MKLIDLLVSEFPERGRWSNLYLYASQDKDGDIFLHENPPVLTKDDDWWAVKGNFVRFLNCELSDDWNTAVITREQYEAALEAANKPVWDGEGLPPVGCNCLVSCEDHADHEWIKIKVVHVHNGEVIGVVDMPGESIHDQISKYSKDYNKAFFIPMPTEAERKREAAVDKILELMELTRESPTRWGLDKIYNWIAEGKIPGIRLEDEAGR